MKRIEIKDGWMGLWYRIGARSVNGWDVFQDIYQHYSEPHRHYHDFSHLLQMFGEFTDEVRHLCHNPLAVEMFIWRHDYVYTPLAQDNEERSAEETQSMLKSARLPQRQANPFIAEVCRLILLTKKHVTTKKDINGALAIDLDLSIWGQPVSIFDAYESNIREEYVQEAGVSEGIYRAKRAEFLERFLDRASRKSIYLTPYFRKKYEKQAQKNLTRSLAKLKNV